MEIPALFNAADYFVDRHLREGRGERVAIECGDERVTYAQLADRVRRAGAALVSRFGVRREERVLLWLPDGPAFCYGFWGAIRIGAVPVPVNTMWTAHDLAYVLNDSRARVVLVSAPLRSTLLSIPLDQRRGLEHIGGVLIPGHFFRRIPSSHLFSRGLNQEQR